MLEWNQFLARLKIELGAEAVEKWVPKLVRFDAANVYLEEPDSFQQSWFDEYVKPRLKDLKNNNQRLIKVHFLSEEKEEKKEEKNPFFSFRSIDPEMTLEHFSFSEENQVVAKLLSEPSTFNPIFIYGPSGVGKTHLLMGFARTLQKKGQKVLYVRAETFTEHVVQAMRLGKMQEFRKIYREIDALIIDDIHLFSKKTATQEEFFHTFNTHHTLNRPLLFSANIPPSKLQEVEPRLISRFEWGISLELKPSSPIQILKSKEKLWETALNEELRQWLIRHFPQNFIQTFQALILRAKNTPLSCLLAEKLLKDFLEKAKENAITPMTIIKQIALDYGLTSEDLLGKSQVRKIALSRQIAMYLCRKKLSLPFQQIGKIFQRDHSTVMSSIKLVEEKIAAKEIAL